MNRQDYEKPAMRVVELRHRTMILAGSAGVQDYNWHDEEEE